MIIFKRKVYDMIECTWIADKLFRAVRAIIDKVNCQTKCNMN